MFVKSDLYQKQMEQNDMDNTISKKYNCENNNELSKQVIECKTNILVEYLLKVFLYIQDDNRYHHTINTNNTCFFGLYLFERFVVLLVYGIKVVDF